jgi:hypothetical protein
VLVVHAPTRTLNPTVPQSEIDAAFEDDPILAGSSYLARWRDDMASYVDAALLDSVTDFGVYEREYDEGCHYVAFADIATGQGQDNAALTIAHQANGGREILVDVVRTRKPRFVLSDLLAEWSSLLRKYHCRQVWCDAYALGIAKDMLAENGITANKSETDTSANFLRCLPILTAKRARLVDCELARREFAQLQRRVTAGHEVVGHPVSGNLHDDTAASIAGALVTIASVPRPMIISAEIVEQMANLAPRRRMVGVW